jgi:hypothetical protein
MVFRGYEDTEVIFEEFRRRGKAINEEIVN